MCDCLCAHMFQKCTRKTKDWQSNATKEHLKTIACEHGLLLHPQMQVKTLPCKTKKTYSIKNIQIQRHHHLQWAWADLRWTEVKLPCSLISHNLKFLFGNSWTLYSLWATVNHILYTLQQQVFQQCRKKSNCYVERSKVKMDELWNDCPLGILSLCCLFEFICVSL